MNPHIMTAACLSLVAGSAVATADRTPHVLHHRTRPAGPITYVYIHAATGERLFTAEPGRPVSTGRQSSDEIWIADNTTPCAAYGLTTGLIGVFDDPGYSTAAATRATFLDWGDVGVDTVVDCVQVTWSSAHADVDHDGDGFADGVEGFGSTWTWYDIDNGFNDCNTRFGLMGFTLSDLPGNPTPDVNEFATYIATVDLVAGFPDPLSFEICDTDGDPQGAALFNPFVGIGDVNFDGIPDADLDGDGLADFSYGQNFYQPGTTDFDGDGIPDGDPAATAQTALLMVAPSGPAVQGDPGWTIDPVAPLPAGQGMEDFFDILIDINDDGFYEPFGTFFYGGFSCDRDGNGIPGDASNDYRPFSQFYHVLYGPGSTAVCCRTDIGPDGTCNSGDGLINFFDVANYIALFKARDPHADFFPTDGGDGVFDFFDVSTFIAEFNAGCP
jgi:hypothetical protein